MIRTDSTREYPVCWYCGYQSCTCKDCGGQTLDPPCGGCERCVWEQTSIYRRLYMGDWMDEIPESEL